MNPDLVGLDGGGEGLPDRIAALEAENRKLRGTLTSSEARFHSIVERSIDGVIVVNEDGQVRFANGSALDLFGRDPEDLVGSDFGFPVGDGDRSEIDLLRPDGGIMVCEMLTTGTTWEGDEALLVLIRDVTDRREAEEKEKELIREQAARQEAEAAARRAEVLERAGQVMAGTLELDELLRGLADVIADELGDVCLIDVDDGYGPLRRLVAARRDYPRQALLRGLEERPVRLGLDTAEARVFRAGRSELVSEVTDEWLAQASEDTDQLHALQQLCPLSLMMVSLHAGTLPWGIVTILSCESERRFEQQDLLLAEELIRRAGIAVENARLFRLARESSRAKSDFLAVVSHELRTPLSAMIGYAGLLSEGLAGPLSGKQAEYVDSIRQSAEHLVRLIDQIITFARLEGDHERLEIGDVDPSEVLASIATLIRPLAEKRNLELRVDAPGDGASFRTDERKLSQVLVNLATNAVKYTREGEVRLEAEVGEEDVTFRVRDTGRGIPEEELEAIFEPFRQLDDPQTRGEGGAGIGLSVVKNLTRLLGGEIGVQSEPGRGSTFIVRLPKEHVAGVAGKGAVPRAGGGSPAPGAGSVRRT